MRCHGLHDDCDLTAVQYERVDSSAVVALCVTGEVGEQLVELAAWESTVSDIMPPPCCCSM